MKLKNKLIQLNKLLKKVKHQDQQHLNRKLFLKFIEEQNDTVENFLKKAEKNY